MELLAPETIVCILSFTKDIRDVVNFGMTCSFHRGVVIENAKAPTKPFSIDYREISGTMNALGEAYVVSYEQTCSPDKEEGFLVKGIRQGTWIHYSKKLRTKSLMRNGRTVHSHRVQKYWDGSHTGEEIFVGGENSGGEKYATGTFNRFFCETLGREKIAFFKLGSQNMKFFGHCCKEHQKEMPDSLFSDTERDELFRVKKNKSWNTKTNVK